MAAKTTFNFVR